MKLMVKFQFPTETGNGIVGSGKINDIFQKLMEDLKPEAAYFYAVDGDRGGVLFVNATDSSEIVSIVEPFWFGLNAKVEVTPVMSAEDLTKGLAGIPGIVSRYH